MSFTLTPVATADKPELYRQLLLQLEGLLHGERPFIYFFLYHIFIFLYLKT